MKAIQFICHALLITLTRRFTLDKVKKAKQNVVTIGDKLKAATIRLSVAQNENASEKKIALCEKHIIGWESKLGAAKDALKIIKADAKKDGSVGSRIKRTLSYTGLAITVVVITVVGALLYNNSNSGTSDGEAAADSV
jgi:hypothetical protein